MNDSLLFQKSRDKWIKEGDSNTKYFHNMVNWRRRTNAIKGLRIQGNWVEDPMLVKNKVREFFEDRFKERSWPGLYLDGVPFPSISLEENASLTTSFELEEIRSAVWDCEGDKSHGPDGFNFRLLKAFWQEIKMNLVRVLHDFHMNGA